MCVFNCSLFSQSAPVHRGNVGKVQWKCDEGQKRSDDAKPWNTISSLCEGEIKETTREKQKKFPLQLDLFKRNVLRTPPAVCICRRSSDVTLCCKDRKTLHSSQKITMSPLHPEEAAVFLLILFRSWHWGDDDDDDDEVRNWSETPAQCWMCDLMSWWLLHQNQMLWKWNNLRWKSF